MSGGMNAAQLVRALGELSVMPRFRIAAGRRGLCGYVECRAGDGRQRGVQAGPCETLAQLVPVMIEAVAAARAPVVAQPPRLVRAA